MKCILYSILVSTHLAASAAADAAAAAVFNIIISYEYTPRVTGGIVRLYKITDNWGIDN